MPFMRAIKQGIFLIPCCYEQNGAVMGEKDYFSEALQNFSRDFAYGGAIRHLVDKGYDAERIIKEMKYPLPKETIEKMVEDAVRAKR